ncbi:MAG: YecA family protein [Tuberibacillus sp.]
MKAINPIEILQGVTQSYQEVFGAQTEYQIITEYNEVSYHINDRYCMNPGCKCDNVILNFVEINQNSWTKADFSVMLYFKTKKFDIIDYYHISKRDVIEIVKHSLKESDEATELFNVRYQEMKELGRKFLKGIVGLNEVKKPKINRNAPCPCGSGKKYKKCCGAS